jgi:hypothetical protein
VQFKPHSGHGRAQVGKRGRYRRSWPSARFPSSFAIGIGPSNVAARQPVYAKRAWLGLIDPELGPEWPYVIAGILNSAIGQVLYRRLLPSTAGRSRDIRKEVLTNIRVPYMGYSTESFWLAAKLSYRLHMLHEASRALALPAELLDVTARNHWLRLLSELVRLYGFPDPEAQQLVADVLPEGSPI